MAVDRNHVKTVKVLLGIGAQAKDVAYTYWCSCENRHVKRPHPCSLLHIAVCRGYNKIAKLLIQHGATAGPFHGNYGESALDTAFRCKNFDIAVYLMLNRCQYRIDMTKECRHHPSGGRDGTCPQPGCELHARLAWAEKVRVAVQAKRTAERLGEDAAEYKTGPEDDGTEMKSEEEVDVMMSDEYKTTSEEEVELDYSEMEDAWSLWDGWTSEERYAAENEDISVNEGETTAEEEYDAANEGIYVDERETTSEEEVELDYSETEDAWSTWDGWTSDEGYAADNEETPVDERETTSEDTETTPEYEEMTSVEEYAANNEETTSEETETTSEEDDSTVSDYIE